MFIAFSNPFSGSNKLRVGLRGKEAWKHMTETLSEVKVSLNFKNTLKAKYKNSKGNPNLCFV